MTYRTRDPNGKELPKKRPRKRRGSVISQSPHYDEYASMMKAGYSSPALELYAQWRFGETIAASTFRSYRAKKKWPAGQSVPAREIRPAGHPTAPDPVEDETSPAEQPNDTQPDPTHDHPLDILAKRTDITRLQEARVAAAFRREIVSGVSDPNLRMEIGLLRKLYEDVRDDLQLIGWMPTEESGRDLGERGVVREESGERVVGVPSGGGPSVGTLGQLVGVSDADAERRLARVLHDFLPPVKGQVSGGNGHGRVVDGDVG